MLFFFIVWQRRLAAIQSGFDPMIGIVLVSHGDLADALRSAATMILGEQVHVAAVPFAIAATPESLHEAVAKAIESADDGEGVLLLADLFGGTPARVICEQVLLHGVPAVSGVNLPMLLEVCVQRQSSTLDELRQIAYDCGRAGVIDIGARLSQV